MLTIKNRSEKQISIWTQKTAIWTKLVPNAPCYSGAFVLMSQNQRVSCRHEKTKFSTAKAVRLRGAQSGGRWHRLRLGACGFPLCSVLPNFALSETSYNVSCRYLINCFSLSARVTGPIPPKNWGPVFFCFFDFTRRASSASRSKRAGHRKLTGVCPTFKRITANNS
jgi:hypothetical protein